MPRRSVVSKWTGLAKQMGVEEDQILNLQRAVLVYMYVYSKVMESNQARARDFVRYYFQNDPKRSEGDTTYYMNSKDARFALLGAWYQSEDGFESLVQRYGHLSDQEMVDRIVNATVDA